MARKLKVVKPIVIVAEPRSYKQEVAQVLPGVSIWLYGLAQSYPYIDGKRAEKPVVSSFSHFWSIGDFAEYGSYNLSYTGKIVSITEKTVTIEEPYSNKKRHRLTIDEFTWRNSEGMDAKRERNANWSD